MKKLLFVFFVLAVVMGSTSLHAQNFFLTDDDEREIPLFIIRKSKCSRVSKRKVHFTKRSV